LNLSHQPQADDDEDDDDDDANARDRGEDTGPEKEQLGELYKRAIRMNAENQGSMREFLEFEID
jgi:hypothetical protein